MRNLKKTVRKAAQLLVNYEAIAVVIAVAMAGIAKVLNWSCSFFNTLLVLMVLFTILRLVSVRIVIMESAPVSKSKKRRTYK